MAALALLPEETPLKESHLQILLGVVLQRVGRWEEATRVMREAVELAISGQGSQWDIDSARYAEAEHFFLAGRFADVPGAAAEISAESVLYPHAKALTAVALRRLGDPIADQMEAAARAAATEDQLPAIELLLANGVSLKQPRQGAPRG